ncbi:hypothetical protein FGG08_000837 [Glutinoglossum americanum]|uniref:Transcriptional regulatory protein DEP1 n=1 Tax=Glutinoglossum americanum TaxID=1670608 RepID=A0A9P8L3E1_9PEZI|nr:hypothetical protein FGG08_000837 [Glutinoglossum americanum]
MTAHSRRSRTRSKQSSVSSPGEFRQKAFQSIALEVADCSKESLRALGVAARKSLEAFPGPELSTDHFDERIGTDSDTIQVAYNHRSNHAMAKAHLAEFNGPVTITSKPGVNGEIAMARAFTPPLANESNIINPIQNGDGTIDDGSSILSDVEDGVADEDDRQHQNGTLSETAPENDSEAETERLENSPQRIRKRRNVILSSEESVKSIERSPSKLANETVLEDINHTKVDDISTDYDVPMGGTDQQEILEQNANGAEKIDEDNLSMTGTSKSSGADPDPTTAPTSLDSAGEGTKVASPPEIVGKKRKRTSPRNRSGSNDIEGDEPARKRTGSIKGDANGNEADKQENRGPDDPDTVKYNGTNMKANAVNGDDVHREPESNDKGATERDCEPSAITKATKSKKGKRKEKKSKSAAQSRPGVDRTDSADVADIDEANGEEPGSRNVEEATNGQEGHEGDADEAEAILRNEEEVEKKRTAMDSLGVIEKHFATFRDKLYEERLAQLDHELSLLTGPNPTHPEYLAALQCIDARRDEKIAHENKLLEYKLKTLEITSVAERAQIHSQYFQTVRMLREERLEGLGEQWYKIQRDRRGFEAGVPDYMYKFPTRRSQQIAQQAAYNTEVSILSGIAKHVGFPAMPDVAGARPSEIEDDFAIMGIKPQPLPVDMHQHSNGSVPRAASGFSPPNSLHRPKLVAAEEQFLQQNPWANPQHPENLKHYHHSQRQAGLPLAQQQSLHTHQRTGSPFSNPALQKRRDISDVSQHKS